MTALYARTLGRASNVGPALLKYKLAFRLGMKLLPEFHSFIVSCVHAYLELLDTHSDFEFGEATSAKPEMLQYMIDMYGQQLGASGDPALHFSRLLAQYYENQDVGQSAQIRRRIYELSVLRYGKTSLQAKAATNMLVIALDHDVRLQTQEHMQYSDSVFDNIVGSFAVTGPQRIKASISKAESCKTGMRDDLVNAEFIYFNLWHGITKASQFKGDVESMEKQIQIALLYVRYLRESKRIAEVQSTLLGFWGQFEGAERSQTVNELMKEIASELDSTGFSGHSLTIVNSVLDWYRVHAPL